jgi:hypothetical protein
MSTIKVNTVTKRTGSTLTLGESGTTVTLACGATQTGFGRTGTVDWCTTAKTSPFTSVSGKGYFVNTTSGAVTVTLPASPSGGDIVAIKDYAKTFDTNNVTVGRNSSKIGGACTDATLNTEGLSATLVYVDGTQGWLVVNDGLQSQAPTAQYVTATGGTVTTSGDFKIHTFTADATFCVSNAGNSCGSNTVEYIVVAGGGGTGAFGSGGGGAGGFRFASPSLAPGTFPGKPLNAPAGLSVTAQAYPITVGAGGSPGAYPGWNGATNGSNSVFSTITSTGGGRGGNECRPDNPTRAGQPGGSGGGASRSPGTGGTGNTPSVSPSQGNDGGDSANTEPYSGGGGGGAIAAGGDGPQPQPRAGGIGAGIPIGFGCNGEANPSPDGFRYYAGGGGAGSSGPGGSGGPGGLGGGRAGKNGGSNTNGDAGLVNTGGGGGGGGGSNPTGSNTGAGGAGGSGVVIIRYKFQ